MLKPLRRAAVRVVKPRVSQETWTALREIDPQRLTLRLRPRSAGGRRYAIHYQRHFSQLRSSKFTLLEIDISAEDRDAADGSSLHRWKRFFPKAEIVGVHLDDKSFVNEQRIHTYQGSQVDADLLRGIARKHRHLKIIIDNGSHRPEHTRATFAILFPLLADGGYYVIERAASTDMIKDLFDGLNHQELDDHQQRSYVDSHLVAVHCYHDLVIIEKGRAER